MLDTTSVLAAAKDVGVFSRGRNCFYARYRCMCSAVRRCRVGCLVSVGQLTSAVNFGCTPRTTMLESSRRGRLKSNRKDKSETDDEEWFAVIQGARKQGR